MDREERIAPRHYPIIRLRNHPIILGWKGVLTTDLDIIVLQVSTVSIDTRIKGHYGYSSQAGDDYNEALTTVGKYSGTLLFPHFVELVVRTLAPDMYLYDCAPHDFSIDASSAVIPYKFYTKHMFAHSEKKWSNHG